MNETSRRRTFHSFWSMPVERVYINRRRNSARGYRMPAEHAHDYYEMVFHFSSI